MTLHTDHIDTAFAAFDEIKGLRPGFCREAHLWILQVATVTAQTAAIQEQNDLIQEQNVLIEKQNDLLKSQIGAACRTTDQLTMIDQSIMLLVNQREVR